MSHDTITILFWISLIIGMPGGILLFVWWYRKVRRGLMRSINAFSEKTGVISTRVISGKAFFRCFPGLILLLLCCVPALYFSNLLKREDYCIQVIQVNKGITKTAPIFTERCACLDLDELFEKAALR